MKIFSFNVNSIRKRLHQLESLIQKHAPDVICLQETKVQDHDFPVADIENLGFKAEFYGQKTHYGVATLYNPQTIDLSSVTKGFATDTAEHHKRLIITDCVYQKAHPIKIINGYFPQGESRNHEIKFPYKQAFYQDLISYLQNFDNKENLVVLGDLNISPTDKDIGIGEVNRKRWLAQGKTSFLPEEREWLAQVMDWGLFDSFRTCHAKEDNRFSWFDYRSRGFDDDPKRGLRIDTLLVSKSLNERVVASDIDYEIRAMENPSDHAPVWSEFKF